MKPTRVATIAMSLVFLGATSMASAQAPKKSTTTEKTTTEKATTARTGDQMSAHTIEGEVTKVDAKKGWIDVKTSEGSMKLHFPPESLASIQKGDSVSVQLAIKDNGPAASKDNSSSPSGSVKSKSQ
jgi:dsDNA-specific endonuclease/ATPase MutS2